MASPYLETASVLLSLHMTVNSGFGMVCRDRFRLASRTLNQAVFEQDVSRKRADMKLYLGSTLAKEPFRAAK